MHVLGASGLLGGALLRALGADAVGTYRRRKRPHPRALDASDAAVVYRRLAVEALTLLRQQSSVAAG